MLLDLYLAALRPGMLTIVSDTHGATDHRLEGRALEAVREADLVIHAGDFTTASVYEAFERASSEFAAVRGNNDDADLRARLPAERTVEWAGTRFLVVHGHEHTETALSMLARQEGADVVIVGHSHRPELRELGESLLVNPGSHADPRRFRPAHVEVNAASGGIRVRLRGRDGTLLTEVYRAPSSE